MEIDCREVSIMSQGKAATIYDIASVVKVSPSTVSRVLTHSKHPVSSEVRERILRTAEELHYIPNAQARYLKTQNNPSIGIIIPAIENPFYPMLVRGMADVAVEQNYSIYLSNCDREYQLTDRQVQNMLKLNVHGIISVYLDTMTPSLQRFIERGGTLVALSSKNAVFTGTHNVRVDKILETKIAMEHLLSCGHRRIALFMDALNCQIRYDKVEGYRRALESAGIPVREEYIYVYGRDCAENDIVHGKTDADRAEKFVGAFLERSPECTAVLCMNDILALGVCAAFRGRGLQVPQDYSVMGYDNTFFSAFCYPTITTVALDNYAWGQSLMRYLLNVINEPAGQRSVPPEDLLEPVYLIQRESTAAPRKSAE